MSPQYQFNLNTDPLLNNGNITSKDIYDNIEAELNRLNAIKNQYQINNASPLQANNLWEDVDREVSSLTNEQKNILFNDETYININTELQNLIQTELINSVKNKVANSDKGKELLEKQLVNIKSKKENIINQSNKEMELFKQFRIAVQNNPELTYADFIKSIQNI